MSGKGGRGDVAKHAGYLQAATQSLYSKDAEGALSHAILLLPQTFPRRMKVEAYIPLTTPKSQPAHKSDGAAGMLPGKQTSAIFGSFIVVPLWRLLQSLSKSRLQLHPPSKETQGQHGSCACAWKAEPHQSQQEPQHLSHAAGHRWPTNVSPHTDATRPARRISCRCELGIPENSAVALPKDRLYPSASRALSLTPESKRSTNRSYWHCTEL